MSPLKSKVFPMANLQKVVVTWTGLTGMPGYNVFYRGEADVVTSRIRTFYDAIKAYLPGSARIDVASTGDLVDSVTGAITGSWSTAINAQVAGGGTGGYNAASGALVKWLTAGVGPHRRIIGKTYIVPIIGSSYASDGGVAAATTSAIAAAAAALVTAEAGNLMVWHRPVAGAGGQAYAVNGSTSPAKVAVLRSRRD
jgi:hypothetical protein